MNRHCRSRMTGISELLGQNGGYDCRGEAVGQPGDADMQDSCGIVLAMAYVPSQPFSNLYSPEKGLRRGTVFADLDKPYEGGCRR